MGRVPRFHLPLLARELVEVAARRRTYQLRVIYAVVLVLVACSILYSALPSTVSATSLLGIGWPVMIWLEYLQRAGLHLILPVLVSGAFTAEKERNTFGLLLLTGLEPWTIIFEKFFSRLLLALSFLVISVPVLAFAYSLGGIALDDLAAHIYGQLLTTVKIVSICLLCSAYCRTSTGALQASYVLIYVIGIAPGLAVIAWQNELFGKWAYLPGGLTWVYNPAPTLRTFFDLPPVDLLGRTGLAPKSLAGGLFLETLISSVPPLLLCGACLLLARYFLVSRALAAPTSRLQAFSGWLDQWFRKANDNQVTRGVVVFSQDSRPPNQAPVAWRETTTRSLVRERYIFRWLLAIELPLALFLMIFPSAAIAKAILVALWVVLVLVTCVLSAGLIPNERQRQTLDVLLATPISGREIVLQKMAGLRRFIWICQVPMWTCLFFYAVGSVNEHYQIESMRRRLFFPFGVAPPVNPGFQRVEFVINHAVMLLLYPPLISWIGMWHGLRSRTAVAAMMKTFASMTVRCVVPVLIAAVCFKVFPGHGLWEIELRRAAKVVSLISPATLVYLSEIRPWTVPTDGLFPYGFPFAVVLTLEFQGLLLYWIRSKCLSCADELLGRVKIVTGPALEESLAAESVEFENQLVHSGSV